MIDPAQLQAEVDSFAWYHSIDLGHGVVTKGQSVMAEMVTEAQLPDFRGRSVLDIGAWDGYYSFLAERRGASRVVALDHYAWGVDFTRAHAVLERVPRARASCPTIRATRPTSGAPTFPAGADSSSRTACSRAASSRSSPTSPRWTSSTLGTFDIVLYLGVLYHMKEPLTCLERLRAVTGEVAVIETVAAQVPGNAGRSLLELHAGGELNADFGNWYVPTVEAIGALARASGFARVEVMRGPPPLRPRSRLARRLRLVPATGRTPRPPTTEPSSTLTDPSRREHDRRLVTPVRRARGDPRRPGAPASRGR